ncbi:MAG: S9 family peptidase [Bacteroidaceae bacterium]|nr:S9 family peptidase [Bacteroidaceae bacterium]
MKRIALALLGLLALSFYLLPIAHSAEPLDLKELCSGQLSARRIYGVRPMNDGEQYSQLTPDAKQIVTYSFRTGEQTGVLFDVSATKGKTRLERIDGYVMSPDERNILIQTETKSIYRRSKTAVYYIYNVKNKTLQTLSDGGPQECPVWSPDGYMVAFVRDNDIHLVKLLFDNSESQVTKDGEFNKIINGKPDWVNEEEFLTDRSLAFNADNTMLCWIRYDEQQVPQFSFPWYKGLAPERQEFLTYPGQYSYKYPMAGEANSKVSVMSYDIKSHRTQTLQVPLDADGYIPRIFPTSDPSRLAVVTLNRHQDRMDIYMANPRSTEARLVVRDEVAHYIGENAYDQIRFFDGGFVMTSERDGWNHIYQYDLNGTLRRQVTKGEFAVTELYGYDPLTGSCYYQATDGGPLRRAVFKSDGKGRTTRLSQQSGTNAATFSHSFRYFINVYSNLQTPPVTTLCDATGKTTRTLIDNHELLGRLATKQLGTKEFFTFRTQQGTELNGYMVRPADFDASRRYPVVLFQYSGPGSQQVLDSWQTGNMGGCLYEQYLAQLGFISVCVDGRGTGGRGAAFEKQTYLRLGQMEAEDQVETAIYLSSLPYVDKARIGIWGWSFGGFCTLMSMSEGRPVFAAGVAVAPPTCWRYYDSIYTERFMRTPKENPDGYDVSALSRAPQLSGHLLICHGLADDNVHFRNTAEYAEALVQADKDFKMQAYTNRNHSIFGGNTRYHLYRQITRWFQDYLTD